MNENYSTLDFLRAISALIVAWGHSRFIMLVPSAEVVELSILDKIIYFISGFGPQAVIVFFVLSGFFISRSIEKRIALNSFSLKTYFKDRYFRLSVVAIPAILITLILDNSALNLFDKQSFYLNRLDWLDSTSYSSEVFFGNIFYLQTLFYNSFGSNGPLWSLAYEWWFYVLAPFLILPMRKRKFHHLTIFLVFSVFIGIANYKILIYFGFWLLGATTFYLSKRPVFLKVNHTSLIIFSLTIVFLAASITRLRYIDKILGDFLISFSVAVLIYFLIRKNYRVNSKILTFFTNISYSLYATHLPFIVFIVSIVSYFEQKLQPNFYNSFLNILVLIAAIFFSYLFWWVFERNTNFIKNQIQNIFK